MTTEARSPSIPSPGSRIGVFGGTFDPLHIGHLIAAQDVAEALELDRMLFVLSARPPHKQRADGDQDADGDELTPASLRMRMLREALSDHPVFEPCELELRREGISYTVDTLRELEHQEPEAERFLVLGADQWAGFGSWREPREIARLARLVVMTRSGDRPAEVDPGFDDGAAPPPITEVAVTRIDLSSSAIRERIRTGRSHRFLVPDAVRRIIDASKMYL